MEEKPEKFQLFHILFRDRRFLGDDRLVLSAIDKPQALEKARRWLRHKRADDQTISVLTDEELGEKFPEGFQYFYVLYQNGTGQKHCRILATNQQEAETKFRQRFNNGQHIELIGVLTQTQFTQQRHNCQRFN